MDNRRDRHRQAHRHPPTERRIRYASHHGCNTGKGIWFTNDGEWHIDLQAENEYPLHDAEVVAGVYGDDEEEWEERANEKLAYYGLKLSRFDENAGDRWELIEL